MNEPSAVAGQFEITAALNRALFAQATAKHSAEALKRDEDALKEATNALEALLLTHNMRGVKSTLGSADIVDKVVYNVEDWTPFYAHVQRTGEFDLLYKRVGQKAVADRDSNNALPPGVKRVVLPTLKLTVGG